MKKRICFVCLITVFFSGMLFAQDNKVVVVPLLGDAEAQVGGSNRQVQYNDNGKLEGAEVYYDKSNRHLGIGGVHPDYEFYVNGSGFFSQYGKSPGLVIKRYVGDPLTRPVSYSTEIYGKYLNAYFFGRFGDESDTTLFLNNESEGNVVLVDGGGDVGIGTTSPKGKLDVNGSIYQRGSSLHADYVFDPKYKLESIEEHAEYMWKEKHLKAVPKVQYDENGLEVIEVGSHRKGMLEELEKAHIYIEHLNKQIAALKSLVCQDHPDAVACK